MKISKNIHYRNNWLKKSMLSHAYQPWLIDNGSLTALLQQRYVNFSVRPVTLEYAKPLLDEAVLLKHSCAQRARIREVLLMGNQQPVVFAHSVLPSRSLRGEWHRLGKLGNKPLGATLFANPKVKRTPLAFKKLSRHHPLYRRAIVHVAQPTAFLWARRSVFNLNCANILVTEVFLPPIL